MLMQVRNFTEANRYSAQYFASETSPIQFGQVVKIVDDGTGGRRMQLVVTGDAGKLKPSEFGLAFKVSTDAVQVSATTAPAFTGIRTVQINPGDMAVQVSGPCYVQLDPSLLHASLDPARSGTLPAVNDVLGVDPVTSTLCTAGFSGAIVSPVAFTCYEVAAGQVTVYVRATPA